MTRVARANRNAIMRGIKAKKPKPNPKDLHLKRKFKIGEKKGSSALERLNQITAKHSAMDKQISAIRDDLTARKKDYDFFKKKGKK